MYQARYDDIMSDGADSAKEQERSLFDQSILMLEQARDEGGYSYKGIEAVQFTSRLWMLVIEDLGNAANGLPAELRASLISIGIFIIKELEAIRQETSTDYDSIIEITKSIRDGL
ncbi:MULTISPECIES: flagellar biosynthesis regulator FlaF [Phyllobacterium]|uniref:Flagellar biosynthesis regulator FlhF n=1 Tax=Phyllobacterium sophorae TaxID=1520277 RepID=A0A2P7B622_9HYPH|nr:MULTISPECIES: flagellar biosynthesis regulator FlaF [Phyllobacterium]PSH61911.1 flagellar biosynthesis regulator FlhF [Phyllobacterium sophorae]UXN66607.1 flagellar biosynthesis regulator FlaF [Phyllobacterium sp. A18/5-2]